MKKKRKVKKEMVCTICGLSGPTKCTEQANCLNVTMEAEEKMKKLGII